MTESFDDYEMKDDQINQEDDKSSKEAYSQEGLTLNYPKKNTHINFKVIKSKNKQNIANTSDEEKKKELEMLLDNFNMSLKRKRKNSDNYIEFLIGRIN
jgi:hypothetical protein